MQIRAENVGPRSTTDLVFNELYEDIVSLRLLPGAKISEAEIAKRMGVSRQPVRDAFNRLVNLDLLLIRPQRATTVRRFSITEISNTRFVRLAVELEVVEQACAVRSDQFAEALDDNLSQQQAAVDAGQEDTFHALDYAFHKLICDFSGRPLAYEIIEKCKRQVDRLCLLSLGRDHEAQAVLDDHRAIAEALKAGSVNKARAQVRRHLGRLDDTIAEIYQKNADFFEDPTEAM